MWPAEEFPLGETTIGLYDFTRSEVAQQAESLALRLLTARVREVRERTARYYDALAEYPPADIYRLALEIDQPPLLLGAGVISGEEDDYPLVVVNQAVLRTELPEGQPLPISDTDEVARALDETGGYQPTTRVLVVPTPELQFEPGAEVRCSGLTGTLGARVTSVDGNDAILTAGHAAPGGVARNNNGDTGFVKFSSDPARLPASAVTVDVAVIETTHLGTGGPPISGQTTVKGRDTITLHGQKSGQQSSDVLAFCLFFNTPTAGGEWANVYLTSAGISQRGDSGGPVIKQGTDELVGHLVGGSGTTTSYIQEIDTQLKACGATLK